MKLSVAVTVTLFKTIDVPDELWAASQNDKLPDAEYDEACTKFQDHISNALPGFADGWDDWDWQDETYTEVTG